MSINMIQRAVPSTREMLPVIGLGTWKVLDTNDESRFSTLKAVLKALYDGGGRMIDSSPMYGHSEEVIGRLTDGWILQNDFFYATKVWIEGKEAGIKQMESSMHKMKRDIMDLMQIHNLVDWEVHYKTLRRWKSEGKVRYIGLTHYQSAMHETLEDILNKTEVDFVQFNYSLLDRHAEKRLLPFCAEKGIATIINRPLGEGKLMQKVKDKKLPGFAKDYGMESWAQFFLKYIISHPAVTSVITATSNPEHMKDSLQAAQGDVLPEDILKKMADFADENL